MKRLVNLFILATWLFIGAIVALGLMRFEAHPIVSGSMKPAIDVGSLVLVKNVPVSSLEKGDVIAFKHRDMDIEVAHRIILLQEKSPTEVLITTKGDANRSDDGDPYLASKTDALGKVYATIPYMGYVMVFLGTPLGRLCLMALIALSLLIFFWPARRPHHQAPTSHTPGATP